MSDTVENMDVSPDAEADMQHDVLSMSDEDFMNANESDLAGQASEYDNGDDEQGVLVEQPEEGNKDNSDQPLGDDSDEDDDLDPANEEEDPDNAEDGDLDQAGEDDESEDDQPSETSDGDIDYEAEYKKLFEPIKSSGREIKMRNVEHIKNYIQMGDDYNKKMHELKPYMKSLRNLKANKLIGEDTSDERLNFLIELDQMKPEAIKRLIADSGMDIYELQDEEKYSPEEAKKYKPTNKMVSDAEFAIEDAIKNISGSESFDKTIEVMTETFDEKSRDIIAENPSYIKSLNHDIANGSYDVVMDEVKYARDMKMIPDEMSDIEAYIATVSMLQAKEQSTKKVAEKQTKTRTSNKKKKIGMSSSSSRPVKKQNLENQDFMAMSDEDFAKLDTGVL